MLFSWLSLLRLPTLPLASLPVISAFYLAKNNNPDLLLLINIIASACLIQIISNIANDYFDYTSGDDLNLTGRKKSLIDDTISLNQIKLLLKVLTILVILISIPLVIKGGLPILLIGFSAIFFAFLYSYSTLSLAKNFLAELTAFLYFGPIATWGSYYLLSGSSSLLAILIGLPAGLISLNLLTINNWRDYQADKLSGRKNLVQLFGLSKIQYIFILSLITINLSYYFIINYPANLMITFVIISLSLLQLSLIKSKTIKFAWLFKTTSLMTVYIQVVFLIQDSLIV